MTTNYPVDKSVLNVIHTRDFFSANVANNFAMVGKGLKEKHQPTPYGFEIPDFNMIHPEMDLIMGSMLGDWIRVIPSKSGTFRIPYDNLVHFEDFESLKEWRLAVALEDNTFRTYRHVSGAKDARFGHEFDYHNPHDWIREMQLNIAAGDAVIYRPWVFHSFEAKHIHTYHLLVDQ